MLNNRDFSHFDSLDFGVKIKELELKGEGRILVRKSGTEKLIRVMVEGKEFW